MLVQFKQESMKEQRYEKQDNGYLFSSATSYADRTPISCVIQYTHSEVIFILPYQIHLHFIV
jgi:hypothetical protein